jgi:hypothetical protein
VSLALLCLCAALPGAVSADEKNKQKRPTATAHVVLRSGALVYIDAGREEGLREGDRLEVLRDGSVAAVLTVSYLSSHRASCALKAEATGPEIGAVVRFTPHVEEPVQGAMRSIGAPPTVRRRGNWFRRNGLRGRVGVRYLTVRDQTGTGGDFSQPALDLRLDGNAIGGSNFDLAVDVRGRRTYTTLVNGSETTDDLTRIYRLSTSWNSDEGEVRMTVGRQYSSSLSSVSIFDGVLADFGNDRWRTGVFSGTQPDLIDFGYSSLIREHGLYYEVHNESQAVRRWNLVTGAVGSYTEGEINREFIFIQSRYVGPRLTFYLLEEVDYNRGWKTEFEDSALSPTSTFFNLQFRAADSLDLRAGYDNRRRIRLYRDRVTPETMFDDDNRIGARVGMTWRSPRHYRVALDALSNQGNDTADSNSYTLTLGASSFTRQNMGIFTRSTQYTNAQVEGWLHSASLGMNLGRRVHIQLGGGVRDEMSLQAPVVETRLTWKNVDLDFSLGRHWYFLISAERTESEIDQNDQLYSSLTYRF